MHTCKVSTIPSSSRRFACIHPNLLKDMAICWCVPHCTLLHLVKQPLIWHPRNAQSTATSSASSGIQTVQRPVCCMQVTLLQMGLQNGASSSHLQHLQDCPHLDMLIPHLPSELWISLYHRLEMRQSSLQADHY